MSSKTLFILLILCGGIAFFALKEPESKKGKDVIVDVTPLKKLKFNSVDSIVLKKDKKEIEINKADSSWKATSAGLTFPVDSDKLRKFVASIQSLTLIDKKASSNKYDAKFGLDEASNPTVVKLLSGSKEVTSLILGNVRKGKSKGTGSYSYAPDEGHYLKLGKENNVLLSKDKVDVQMDNAFWLKKEIVKVEKAEISGIDLEYPYKKLSLAKSVSMIKTSTDASAPPKEVVSWKASGDQLKEYAFDDKEIDSLLSELDAIEVAEPASKSLKEMLTKVESYRVQVKRGEAKQYGLTFGHISDAWYVVEDANPEQVYKIDNYRVNNIFTKTSALFNLKSQVILENIDTVTFQSGLSIKNDKDNWAVVGAVPQPEVQQDALKGITDTLKALDLKDYHVKNTPSKILQTLSVKAGEKAVKISHVGDQKLDSHKLIKIEGKEGVFSVSSYDFDKLFPKQSDLLKTESSINAIADVLSIKFKNFSLEKKEDKWLSGEKAVEENRVSEWIDALNNITDSSYLAENKNFTAESTIELTGKDNEKLHFDISKPENGYSMVKSSDFGGFFKVKLEVVKNLLKNQEAFLAKESQ